MRIKEIFSIHEARKNSKLNPKVSVNQHIYKHLEKAENLSGTSIKNSFVSFTDLDKLGINPGTTGDFLDGTPLGIYAYPSEYIRDAVGDTTMDGLDFAGERPYANIFSVKGNIVDLNNMTENDLKRYTDAMVDAYSKLSNFQKDSIQWKQVLLKLAQIIETNSEQFENPGDVFWNIGKEMSFLSPTASDKKYFVWWNKIFREIGVDGCIDYDGIIAEDAEPVQAVFFARKSIVEIKRVRNDSWHTKMVNFNQNKKKLSQMSQNQLIKVVQKDVRLLKHIKNPSEAVQLAAVNKDPLSISYIKNPSEAVQLAAVNKDSFTISLIKNPSEAVQLAAIMEGDDPWGISHIEHPSEAVQLAAVNSDPSVISYIKNPTDKVKQLAAKKQAK